jgi:hypothetical protein
MIKLIGFLMVFFSLTGFSGFAQTKSVVFDMVFKTWEEDSNKVLKNTKIEIFESGKIVKTLITDNSGKAYCDLEINKEYTIHFKPKRGGYIEKHVIFDLRNIDLAKWKYKD